MMALALFGLAALPVAWGHSAFWNPSMWGFNVTGNMFPYDNRPVAPLRDKTFQQWWFHGHLNQPPNPGDFFELPAGGVSTAEIACTKSATSYFNSSDGGDIRSKTAPNDVCPGQGMTVYHTTGPDNVKGCALAIAYKDDVNQVQPEDLTVFSVNQTCVFNRFTDFSIPANLPACPPGGCTCAWFWIHSPESGGEENYMNGFKCNVTGAASVVPVARPQVPRRCGKDLANGVTDNHPGNCTWGAKQPFYWLQKERNNMFEGSFSPPIYTDLYNFADGAQNDIFEDSYKFPLPSPGPNQTDVPPFLKNGNRATLNVARDASVPNVAAAAAETTRTTTVTMTPSSTPSSTPAFATTYTTAVTMTFTPPKAAATPSSTATVYVTETSVVYSTVSAASVPSSSASLPISSVASPSSLLSPTTIHLTAATLKATASSSAPPVAAALAAVAESPSGSATPHTCKPNKSVLAPQRRSLSSFHATTKFSRRKLKNAKSLWHFF